MTHVNLWDSLECVNTDENGDFCDRFALSVLRVLLKEKYMWREAKNK